MVGSDAIERAVLLVSAGPRAREVASEFRVGSHGRVARYRWRPALPNRFAIAASLDLDRYWRGHPSIHLRPGRTRRWADSSAVSRQGYGVKIGRASCRERV